MTRFLELSLLVLCSLTVSHARTMKPLSAPGWMGRSEWQHFRGGADDLPEGYEEAVGPDDEDDDQVVGVKSHHHKKSNAVGDPDGSDSDSDDSDSSDSLPDCFELSLVSSSLSLSSYELHSYEDTLSTSSCG